MVAALASAVLLCAASVAVGTAIVTLCGWQGGERERGWCWLGPAVGLATLITIAAIAARLPGRATTAFVVLGAVTLTAIGYLAWHGIGVRALAAGLPAALLAALGAALPFIVNWRIGVLGVGLVNDDMASHLLIVDWIQHHTEPTPSLVQGGYPLGPHSLVAALAEGLSAAPVDVFAGLTLAIAALAALTALQALADLPPVRRTLAAVLVALCYLAASYLVQGAFKEPLQALFVVAFALGLAELTRYPVGERRPPALAVAAVPLAALAAGSVFNYSFPGLLWLFGTAVLVWLLRGAPLGRLRPALPVVGAAIAVVAVLTLVDWGRIAEFADFRAFQSSGEQALGNLRHSVSPVEALGVWPSGEFRISAVDATLPAAAFYLGALLALAALGLGLLRALREHRPELPAALAAALAIYVAAAVVGTPYTSAKALAIAAPIAMLIALRGVLSAAWLPRLPLSERRTRLAVGALATAFVIAAAGSSFLALRQGPVGPGTHAAELARIRPEVEGSRVLFLGRDDFIAWELRGAEVKTQLQNYYDVGQVDAREVGLPEGEEKFDFDAVPADVLDRFRYVLTSGSTYASAAPPSFRPILRTRSFVLWKRRAGERAGERDTLQEGAAPGATLNCRHGPGSELHGQRGRAVVWPRPPLAATESDWTPDATVAPGDPSMLSLRLAPGVWRISLAYDSPRPLSLIARGEGVAKGEAGFRLPANLDFRGPTPFFPAGRVEVDRRGDVVFDAGLSEAPLAGRLLGAEGEAHLRGLAATPSGSPRAVALSAACGAYVDWYRTAR